VLYHGNPDTWAHVNSAAFAQAGSASAQEMAQAAQAQLRLHTYVVNNRQLLTREPEMTPSQV
jgi:hypothetical protein